jgi:hypothetical protein
MKKDNFNEIDNVDDEKVLHDIFTTWMRQHSLDIIIHMVELCVHG